MYIHHRWKQRNCKDPGGILRTLLGKRGSWVEDRIKVPPLKRVGCVGGLSNLGLSCFCCPPLFPLVPRDGAIPVAARGLRGLGKRVIEGSHASKIVDALVLVWRDQGWKKLQLRHGHFRGLFGRGLSAERIQPPLSIKVGVIFVVNFMLQRLLHRLFL